MQPVGDAGNYSPGCARLAKAYGLLVISLNDGTEQLIPFEDRLYFEHVPENNVGVVGLVYYEFLPLGKACTAGLSPYQEVASGYDNEKFNADYGASITFAGVGIPTASFDKSAPPLSTTNQDLAYSLTVTNTSTGTGPDSYLGFIDQGAPITVEDDVPTGTTYVLGSATANNSVPTGNSAVVTYYNGTTWLATEPSTAADVKRLRWTLTEALAAQQSATFRFSTRVPLDYSAPKVDNCGNLSLGGTGSLASDCTETKISAAYSLSGTVFRDDGAGGAITGDGVRGGSETFLPSVGVSLYLDEDGDGKLDDGELLWETTSSSTVDGSFSFTQLPAAKWLVMSATRNTDTDVPVGYVPSTDTLVPVTLTTSNITGVLFGFAPPLDLTKTLNGISPVLEGTRISYDLKLENLLKPENYAISQPHTQLLWMNTATSGTASPNWTTPGNAAGAPNGTFATTSSGGAVLTATVPVDDATVPNSTPIQHVEAVLRLSTSAALGTNNTLTLNVLRQGASVGTYTISLNAINAFVNTTGEVSVNVTNAAAWDWASLLASNTSLAVTYNTSGNSPTISVDALGFRVVSQVDDNRSGYLYWADNTTTLKVGPTSGGEIEVLIPSLATAPTDIAYNAVNNSVIVANGATIGIYKPDGSFVTSFTAPAAVTGLAVDPNAGYIYWVDSNSVRRATLTGTNQTAIFTGLTNITALTIDPESQQLYWARSNSLNVLLQRGNVTGGSITTIIDNKLGANGNSNPLDIELDHIDNVLYFTNDATGTGDDYIGAVNIDGTNPRRVVNSLTTPRGLAVNANTNTIAWADAGGIKKATLAGTGITTIYPNLTNVSDVELPDFTVDTVGVFDVNRTLAVAPLTDDYDPTQLRYVSASIEPTSVDTVNGLISWSNIGPINPSMSKTIRVTFDALEPANNSTNTNVLNTASVMSAKLADGGSAADDVSAVTITVEPTATIGDLVWSDKNGNGVRDTGEPGLAGVTLELVQGSTVVQTTVTDANGAYSFTGLTVSDGASVTYSVRVVTASLPTGFVQRFDADGTGTANTSSFTLTNPAGIVGPADNLTQDFGYQITNIYFGTVWRDYDGNGQRAS